MPALEPRRTRLAELREHLTALRAEMRTFERGTPEHEAVLMRWEPVLAAVTALSEELEE